MKFRKPTDLEAHNERDQDMLDAQYNGWANHSTWNVALWIGNDEGLYKIAKTCINYSEFVACMALGLTFETGDGIKWTDKTLDTKELDALIVELSDDCK